MSHAERVAEALAKSPITKEERPPVSDKAIANIIRGLLDDIQKLSRLTTDLEARVGRERQLRLGALAVLVADEVISAGRARELGDMSIYEQRKHLIDLLGAEGRES